MIRILHVVSSLNINAGMMSVIMNYYRNIDRDKIQFDFWYFSEMKETHLAEIQQLGGRTYYMPFKSFKLSDQRNIRRFFQEHKGEYAAVHCHPIWAAAIVAKEAKKSGIKHVVQHIHSTRYSEKKSSEIRNRLLMKFVGAYATDLIACNGDAALLFGKKAVKSGKVTIFKNAIDIQDYIFEEKQRVLIRAEFKVSPDTLVVGNVGRFSAEKNHSFILKVFDRLHKKIPDSKLVLVGDGSCRKDVENEICELGLEDQVVLTGRRRDIGAILSGLDLFLMPSVFEGTPVSALEARASGLPCLLSDSISKSVEMDGVRFLSLKEPPERWAQEIIQFLGEWADHDRHDYSEVVNHQFDIRTEALKLQDFYLGLR